MLFLQPKFAGRKAGYYFGKGKAGVGYHRDAKQVRGCMGVLRVPLWSTVDRPRLAGEEVATPTDAATPRWVSGQPNWPLQIAYPKPLGGFS